MRWDIRSHPAGAADANSSPCPLGSRASCVPPSSSPHPTQPRFVRDSSHADAPPAAHPRPLRPAPAALPASAAPHRPERFPVPARTGDASPPPATPPPSARPISQAPPTVSPSPARPSRTRPTPPQTPSASTPPAPSAPHLHTPLPRVHTAYICPAGLRTAPMPHTAAHRDFPVPPPAGHSERGGPNTRWPPQTAPASPAASNPPTRLSGPPRARDSTAPAPRPPPRPVHRSADPKCARSSALARP